MKPLLIAIFTICVFTSGLTQGVEWFRERGTDTASVTTQSVERVLLNSDGSVVAFGGVSTNPNTVVDLDPGPGVYNYTHTGHLSPLVQRFSSNGDLEWTGIFRSGGSTFIFTGSFEGCMNYIDEEGAIYFFVSRNPGSSTTTLEYVRNGEIDTIGAFGSYDDYLIKLAPDGELIWKVRFKGQNPPIGNLYVKEDKIYMYGSVYGTRDYDPGPGSYSITVPTSVSTKYILQLDTSGTFQKARTFYNAGQGSATMISNAMAVNSQHELVIELRLYGGPIDLDPGAGTEWVQSSGSYNMYLLKLDSNWDWSWHHEWNYLYYGQNGLSLNQLTFDLNDHLITSGFISGAVYFNSWNSSHLSQSSLTQHNLFVTKFDSSGIPIWNYRSKAYSQTYSDGYVESLDVSNLDKSIIVTGTYRGDSIGLNPLDSLDLLPPVPAPSPKLGLHCLVLDSSGLFLEGFGLANDSVIYGTYSEIYDRNRFYLSLVARKQADINPEPDTSMIGVSNLQPDVITCLAKYNRCLFDTGLVQDFNCGSYTYGDTTFFESGIYEYPVEMEDGCDSIVVLDLQIGIEYNDTLDTVLCSPTFLGSQLIEESGEYTNFETSESGCDSLTTWIVTYPAISTGIQFLPQEQKLIANEASADQYQWFICDSAGQLILLSGDTGQFIIDSIGGTFAVVITKDGCSDTSDCSIIYPVGAYELRGFSLAVYPNPTKGYFTISSSNPSFGLKQIRIYNTAGQLILEDLFRGATRDVVIGDLPAGVYHLEVIPEGRNDAWRTKLVVQ